MAVFPNWISIRNAASIALIAMVIPSGLPMPAWARLMLDDLLNSSANSLSSHTTPSPMYLAASCRASLANFEIFPAAQSFRSGSSGKFG